MFKQSKKNATEAQPQPNFTSPKPQPQPHLQKTQKLPYQPLSKQLIQFLARQISTIKSILSTPTQYHPDILIQKLHQCTHLMDKKISFCLSNNPQQYHDYIQDFYENQINQIRQQYNHCKLQQSKKRKQYIDLYTKYEIIQQQLENIHKQSLLLSSSRINVQNMIPFSQQNTKLKLELDHCRILLNKNTQLIEEQAKAILQLSGQLGYKIKQYTDLRGKYDHKILQFDNKINNYIRDMQSMLSTLSFQHKQCQNQIRDSVGVKIRIKNQKLLLQKELEIKIQEIQLLTKNILENDIVIGRLERGIVLKQGLIDELYNEIDKINGNMVKIVGKQGEYTQIIENKLTQIVKIEERLKLAYQNNERLQKKLHNMKLKYEQLQKKQKQQNKELIHTQAKIEEQQKQLQQFMNNIKQFQKKQDKIIKQNNHLCAQIYQFKQSYNKLAIKCQQDKINMKNDIMGQINQLVQLIKIKEDELQNMQSKKDDIEKQLIRERLDRKQIQTKFDKMSQFMRELDTKLNNIQQQNDVNIEKKCVLEMQISRLGVELEKLTHKDNKMKQILNEKDYALQILQKQLKYLKQDKPQDRPTKTKASISQSDALKGHPPTKSTQQSPSPNPNKYNYESINQQLRKCKQILSKKDFQLKQLESKIKIQKDELKQTIKLFDNEKNKMCTKIKELQQLLRQRYDLSYHTQ